MNFFRNGSICTLFFVLIGIPAFGSAQLDATGVALRTAAFSAIYDSIPAGPIAFVSGSQSTELSGIAPGLHRIDVVHSTAEVRRDCQPSGVGDIRRCRLTDYGSVVEIGSVRREGRGYVVSIRLTTNAESVRGTVTRGYAIRVESAGGEWVARKVELVFIT